MKIRVNPHNVEIVREQTEPINELEVNVSKCEFEFDEKITNEFVKEAYFTLNGSTYKQIIVNNECDYPSEVLTETGTLEIGVVAYKVENGEELIRYNPSPDYYDTWVGSLKDAENSQPITPTDKEQMQSQISQNTSDISDLQTNKQDKLTQGDNITIDENNVISATDTIYDDTEIKADIQELQETKIDKDVNNLTYYTLTTETGSKITLSINSSTYVMTLRLKDKNNNDISTDSIDLPLETMVVGARYDSATKEIVLTLKNGQEVRFSVADLVSGLQTEITENNKLSSDLVDDTNNTNKFVSASEKAQITTNKNDIAAIKDGEEIDSFADVETALNLKEDKSNKVTEINSSSTDTQYPSAKCVYDSQEEQNEQIAELEMLYNAFPTVSDENETIQLDNTAKVKFREIDLKGNTSQVVIPEEQGTSVSNTSIYVSDVDTDKENTIEMSGNTYQANAILPSEYTQVDYIQSSGSQYIDTGINADTKLRTILDIAFINPTSANQTMGAINIGTPNKRYHLLSGSNSIAFWVNNTNYTIINTTSTDRHLWDLNVPEGKVVIDKTTTTTIPTNIDDTELNFWLFGRNSNSTQYKASFKLWACKMYYNGTLVRDFIPCYRNSDNEIGLYDLVNNVFYTNQGTGAFTYGSVASIPNPDYPQNIEVVTGTQNITIANSDNTQSTTYPVNLGNIELCKIDTYQDRIYKQNDKWYLEKNCGSNIFGNDIQVNGVADTQSLPTIVSLNGTYVIIKNTLNSNIKNDTMYCTIAKYEYNSIITDNKKAQDNLNDNTFCMRQGTNDRIYFKNSAYTGKTGTEIKGLIEGKKLYYVLATPTTTEITDTTLVNQLNALYNATIYPITNINTETSNLLPYIDLHYNFVTPSPSPSRPSVVNVVKGNNTITISNSDNTESQSYPINLGDMELCKIGTYQDYIYENNGNWFKKENIGKTTLNGTEDWTLTNNVLQSTNEMPSDIRAIGATMSAYSSHFEYHYYATSITTNIQSGEFGWNSGKKLTFKIDGFTTQQEYTNWLGNNNVSIYYQLATPTDTQITDTTLITQLNNIKKAYSYDTQTNISQTNTDKPFIIYAEAIRSLKDVFE